ncbi:hypothetical protein D187_008120 [Cystobacter fuscus DSM 2262]|uniref:Uncharacterized protein n=1 Tax=Cystobacter fuscus (strain ATCC 25194 / DSM 2262 / NBRC 100088 / M29) TaxID=1242864 RepID=S9NUI9_CYSF2|nr:hypothetical protein [Cystobacter fuscus]EPX55865.1 hypothetical protein D187_008120 [Cystobacter fuscus DSM 2262]
MREVRRFSLAGLDSERGTSRLVRDGKALGFTVEGLLLEEQLELEDGSCLVWLTQDCPFEELLSVYLVGREGQLLDSVSAGMPYAPGILSIRTVGPDWVEFGFFGDASYRLQVEPLARFRRWLPVGWRYHRWLARHRLTVNKLRP